MPEKPVITIPEGEPPTDLLIEDEVVWEQTVDIPAEAEVLQEQIPIDESWPEGAAIGLHLHNHGYNAWTLAELTVIPRGGR